MSSYYTVVTIKNDVVEQVELVVGRNGIIVEGINAGKGVADLAEELFCHHIKHLDPRLSDEEVEDHLDNGWFSRDGVTVCICEPTRVRSLED